MYRPELALQREIISACRNSLAKGAEKRHIIDTPEKWGIWREGVIEVIRSAFPSVIFEHGAGLKSRLVSSYEFENFRIENVIFESLPGWEVNGSVYLPKASGIYPGVVCPTGHSTKTGENYQIPAQVFARNGYIAISFDPPGCAGEIAHLNDHFTNGLIGYLTGFWSQTHFVIDAIRCLDYLSTREDVDLEAGMGVTGVSGGGVTSFFTALLDERVAFAAPVCCLSEHESLHLTGLYTSCPEQFGIGYIASGIDYVDYIAAIAPTPCLIMGGQADEVFDYRSTLRIFDDVKKVYSAAGFPDRCGIYIDESSGHAYTANMANEAVRWMNKYIKGSDASALPLSQGDFCILAREMLLCHPSNSVNMFTINRDLAVELREKRLNQKIDIRSTAQKLLNISADIKPLSVSPRSEPHNVWHALVEDLDIQTDTEAHIPGLMVSHVEDKLPNPGMLWIDEKGRWSALRHDGFLCRSVRVFEPDCLPDQPRVLSIDVSGFGSLAPEPTPYDLAGWNDIERILTYLSLANSTPIMGLRVRDALCGLSYLASRSDVNADRLIVGGSGIGAIVALHVALLNRHVRRVICMDMLSHYGAMTEKFPFSWGQSIIVPEILKYYDLAELVRDMEDTTVFIINPLDAQKSLLSREDAESLYHDANNARVICNSNVSEAFIGAIYGDSGK